jgi:hypothetical protein
MRILRPAVQWHGEELEVAGAYAGLHPKGLDWIDALWQWVALNGLILTLGAALIGHYEAIRFDYGCVDLPPPDPPIGPT